jgi:ATP-dependent exoDNAse (exonuclease V) beta subunit
MDEAARTLFRTALAENFCVIAGAGSGKTTAIVERICELAIRDPNALRRLVVVTFTNSAAIEFKSRSRQRLLDTVPESQALVYLRALEQAYFGTIHGFCLNLIREFRSRLWLPEQLRIVTTQVERDSLWEAFVANCPELAEISQHPVVRSLLRVCTLTDLLEVAKRFRPNHTLVPPNGKMPLPEPARLRSVTVPRNAEKTKQRTIEAVESLVQRLTGHSGFCPVPRRETMAKSFRESFNDEMAPLVAWLEEAAEWFADRLARSFRRHCLQEGIFTYADQIDACVDLLKQPDVLDQVRRRELIVMVDEAQDTDARMFQVFIEVTRPPGEEFNSWPGSGKPPISGRFSLVGDPRQTIFERGKTNRFAELCEHFSSANRVVRFNVTYRCAREVVRGINELFQSDIIDGVPLGDLAARGGAPEGSVLRLPFTLDEPVDSDDELEPLVIECEAVANWLVQFSTSSPAAGSWNDVAIIAPRHDWLTIAGDALKKYGVPYSFFRPKIPRAGIPAFAWSVSLVYTLVRPWDKFERYGVLRELFGVSDTELFLVRKELGEPGKLYREAEELLETARREFVSSRPRSLLYFVDRLLDRFQLNERLIAVGEETSGLDQLRWEAAKADERGIGLEEWVEELLLLLQDSAQASKARRSGVELITIYSAKGLEWDWVIPIGLRKKFSHRSERYPRVETGETCHVVWSNLSRGAARDEDAERAQIKRLLYVMLTRAKTGLVLPTPQGPYRAGRQGTAFNEVIPDDGLELTSDGQAIRLSGRENENKRSPIAIERNFPTAMRGSSSPQPPRLVRPHQLADDSPVLHLQFAESAGAYDYGKWWHSWIEMFPWDSEIGQWESYGNDAIPPISYRERAEKEIAMLLANENLQRLCRGALWFQSEFPFSWPKTLEDWYEGVIDLLIGMRDGTMYIIDWKTNQAASNESAEQLAEHLRNQYLPQLESYREPLQNILEGRKIEIAIYSTVLGRFILA